MIDWILYHYWGWLIHIPVADVVCFTLQIRRNWWYRQWWVLLQTFAATRTPRSDVLHCSCVPPVLYPSGCWSVLRLWSHHPRLQTESCSRLYSCWGVTVCVQSPWSCSSVPFETLATWVHVVGCSPPGRRAESCSRLLFVGVFVVVFIWRSIIVVSRSLVKETTNCTTELSALISCNVIMSCLILTYATNYWQYSYMRCLQDVGRWIHTCVAMRLICCEHCERRFRAIFELIRWLVSTRFPLSARLLVSLSNPWCVGSMPRLTSLQRTIQFLFRFRRCHLLGM